MPDSPQQPPPGPPDVETAKWFEEIKRQDAHRAHDNAHEFYTYVNQATIKTGELTLRMALLINGGAAVSLLTFVGNMPVGRKHAVADTLVWFAAGVALAVAGIGFAYFTSYFMGGHVVSQKRIWSIPIWSPVPPLRAIER